MKKIMFFILQEIKEYGTFIKYPNQVIAFNYNRADF